MIFSRETHRPTWRSDFLRHTTLADVRRRAVIRQDQSFVIILQKDILHFHVSVN